MSVRPGQTARIRREIARAECARVLRASLERHGISMDAIAAYVGASDTRVRKWCDPESPETPGVADLRILPREVVVDIVTWALEEHGLHVFDHVGETGATVEDHLGHLHRVITECADVQREYSLALTDQRITSDKRARILRELREARAALSQLEKKLMDDEAAEQALLSGRGGDA